MKKIWLFLVILGLTKGYGAYKESSFSFDCGKTPRAVHYTAQGFKADTTYFLKLYVSREENGTPTYLEILSSNGAWIPADEDTWQDNLPSFTTLDNGYKEGWVYVRNNGIANVSTYTNCAFSVREGTSGETMKPGIFRPATVMGDNECGWLEGVVRKNGEPATNSHVVFLDKEGKVLGAVDSEPNCIPDDNGDNSETPGYYKIALPSGTIVSTITDWDGNLYDIPTISDNNEIGIASLKNSQGGPWLIVAGKVITAGGIGVLSSTGNVEDIVINEIMYSLPGGDTDYEWIEIYNKGTEAVNIDTSTFKFVTDNAHTLNLIMGTTNLNPGSYAVICQNSGSFTTRYPSFSETLFDSSWSDLSNSGSETLCLKEGSTTFGTVTYGTVSDGYIGTVTEGFSLEKINPSGQNIATNWGQSLVGSGTPGAKNSLTSQPAKIKLTGKPFPVSADNGTSTITGTVTDFVNEPVATTTVHWTLDGVFKGTSSTTNGIATVTITELRTIGTYTVKGTVSQTIEGTTTIIVTSGVPASITLTPAPGTITAGGYSTVTATITDTWGNATDTTIYWIGTANCTLSATSTTTLNGTVTITFTATKTGTYKVIGTISDTASATTTIIVQRGTATELHIILSTNTITADKTATITGIIKDAQGNTETTTELTLTAENGSITNRIFYPNKVGTWTITGTYTGVADGTLTGTATIIVTEGQAAKISAINSNKVGTDSTFNLEVKITDQKDNPVSQIPVISWSIVIGTGTLECSTTTITFNTLTVTSIGRVVLKATITTDSCEFTIRRAQGFIASGQSGETTFKTAYGTVTVSGTATRACYIYIATSTITADLKNKRQIGNIIKISTYGTDGTTLTGILGTFTLELPYSPSWNVSPNTLRIHKSTNTTYWYEIASSPVGNVIRGTIYDFSWFTLGGISAGQPNLDAVFAYPNPWKKKGGPTEIIFKKLTGQATIRIFNVAGEEVIRSPIEHNDGTDEQKWPVPDKLASGVYIYLVEDKSGNNAKPKTGKLGIIK